MNLIQQIRALFKTPEIRNKIIFTIVVLFFFRVLAAIPSPGVNTTALSQVFKQNGILGFLNIFSGGSLTNFAIVSVGLGSFINATVIFQLLTAVIPKLEELSKEGMQGARIITQYTRILTVPLAMVQAFGIYALLRQVQGTSGVAIMPNLAPLPLAALIATLTAGSILLMWFGELITENGIGDGISFLIMATILAGIPHTILQTAQSQSVNVMTTLAIIAMVVMLFTGIVIINEGIRKIPIQYARKVRGNQLVGGGSSFMPLRINTAGVMPIIFAIAILLLPTLLSSILKNAHNVALSTIGVNVYNFISNQFNYTIIYFFLVIIFTYFYTFIVFKPNQIADNIKKQGGFIPGIRPGEQTKKYLTDVLVRLTLPGSVFLAAIAVLPFMVQGITNISTLSIGGTSILIVVSVTIQIIKNVKAMMVTRSYDKYLS